MKNIRQSEPEINGSSEASVTIRRRLRALLLILIGLLLVVSVPWYRPTGAAFTLVWGLPDWVAVALGCYAAVAVLNSAAWLLSEIEDDEATSSDPETSA